MPEAQVFSDRYEMVRHVARGGMAQVYLARDLLLDRPVALKVLFPELSVDQAFVERFRREAKRAANLSHPNIVAIYDWGQGEHTYYIVMEYIDGRTLSSILREGPLEPARAASICADVAGALDFAHRHGVIHRDVKPGNVLIDSSGTVKVTDFGIARASDGAGDDLTQTGSVMGTATYFSPEQAQGQSVDGRSDVYSLGVVLYEMLAGKPPFSGDSPVSIAYKHVTEEPRPPSELNPAAPTALEAIVMKAMAKNPEDRYQSAADLRSDLARFAAGEPVEAFEATRASPTVAFAGARTTALLGGDRGGDSTQVMAAGAGATAALPAAAGYGGPLRPANASARGGPGGPQGGSRAGLYGVLAVLLLVALGAGAFFGGRSLGLWDKTKMIIIPTSGVVGQPLSSAQSLLIKDGFTNIVTRNEASSQYKSGLVAGTDPAPGTKVAFNHQVVLLVSTGPASVAVPSVIGEALSAAESALQGAGFTIGNVSYQASTTYASGQVISTNPAGGTPAPIGSSVAIVVSNGKPSVTIPDVSNELPGPAASQLTSQGLQVVSQQDEPSTSVQPGLVVRTSPPAGSVVPSGTDVTIYVSSGPPVSVPNLIGDTQPQAQSTLQSYGLKGNFSTQTVTDPTQAGVVISQNPAANTPAANGSTVDVVIGSYSPPSTTVPRSSTTTSSVPGPGSGGGGAPLGFVFRRA